MPSSPTFASCSAGNPAPHSDALLGEFWLGWKERESDDIHFGKGEDLDSLALLAERTLTAFQQSPVSRPTGHIVAVEEELRGPIIPGCPDILGRVDLIVEDTDALVVADWKTARARWSREQAIDASEQSCFTGNWPRTSPRGSQ